MPTITEIEKAIDIPVAEWSHQCHAISLAIVKSGALGTFARVARGTCEGVGGQHSWVVLGYDCYAKDVNILDPTWWSYNDQEPFLRQRVGLGKESGYRPHGLGSIWQWGQPVPGDGPVIELTPKFKLSRQAQSFLDIMDPLDRKGWAVLSSAPVQEWPSAEIFAAMDDTPELTALVPIDKLGMLTDRNPSGLFLARESVSP